MGALHQGHLALIRRAAHENAKVYVSIYVNPAQFGVSEDLSSYPRTLSEDMEKLTALNTELESDKVRSKVAIVFNPATEELWPTFPPSQELHGHGAFVNISPLGQILEGASRPVFFRGVTTVCMKLFNLVQPDNIYLGKKDYQQATLLKLLVSEFHIPSKICLIPTIRESDGLAMSSRNVYLGERRRRAALILFEAMHAIRTAWNAGEDDAGLLQKLGMEMIERAQASYLGLPSSQRVRFETDYLKVVKRATMTDYEGKIDRTQGAMVVGALVMHPLEEPQEGEDRGFGGGIRPVRLIDNISLDRSKTEDITVTLVKPG
ncbi:MAG: pantothenate synthase [Icmadophila ericetorum]|nr:pantothenate synthase [Icmadophila ericetorum]